MANTAMGPSDRVNAIMSAREEEYNNRPRPPMFAPAAAPIIAATPLDAGNARMSDYMPRAMITGRDTGRSTGPVLGVPLPPEPSPHAPLGVLPQILSFPATGSSGNRVGQYIQGSPPLPETLPSVAPLSANANQTEREIARIAGLPGVLRRNEDGTTSMTRPPQDAAAMAQLLAIRSTELAHDPTREETRGYQDFGSRYVAAGGNPADVPTVWTQMGNRVPNSHVAATANAAGVQPAGQVAPQEVQQARNITTLLGNIARPRAAGIPLGQTPPRIAIGDFMTAALADPLVASQLQNNLPEFLQTVRSIYATPTAGLTPDQARQANDLTFNQWWETPHPALERNDTASDIARRQLEQLIGARYPSALNQVYGMANYLSPVSRFGFDYRGSNNVQRGMFGNRGSYYNRPLPVVLSPATPLQSR